MSDPALGLTMLVLIIVVILMGFPTAFTLMGLGMFFGFYAFYNPAEHWIERSRAMLDCIVAGIRQMDEDTHQPGKDKQRQGSVDLF